MFQPNQHIRFLCCPALPETLRKSAQKTLKFSQVLRSYGQSLWKNIQAGHTRSDLNGGILQILKDSMYKLLVIENYQLPKKHWRLKLQIRSIDVWQPLGQCQFHQLLTTFNHSRRPHVHQRPDCPTEWCGHLCEWLQKQNAPPATSNVPPPFLRKVKGMVSSIQKKQLFSCWLEFLFVFQKEANNPNYFMFLSGKTQF